MRSPWVCRPFIQHGDSGNGNVACLLEPANRKSAVFSAALKPLREIERDLIEMAAPEVARLSLARRVKESRMKKAEKKACDKDHQIGWLGTVAKGLQ